LKDLLEGFQTYLRPWELCKHLWRYGQIKFVTGVLEMDEEELKMMKEESVLKI